VSGSGGSVVEPLVAGTVVIEVTGGSVVPVAEPVMLSISVVGTGLDVEFGPVVGSWVSATSVVEAPVVVGDVPLSPQAVIHPTSATRLIPTSLPSIRRTTIGHPDRRGGSPSSDSGVAGLRAALQGLRLQGGIVANPAAPRRRGDHCGVMTSSFMPPG